MKIEINPYSTLMFLCSECRQPMAQSPNQLREEPEVTCPHCGNRFKPNLKKMISEEKRLRRRFAELKKQIAEQKKDTK